MQTVYDPPILLLGTYPKRIESRGLNRCCTPMLTEASFTIAKK
jgi:hypothetical protein